MKVYTITIVESMDGEETIIPHRHVFGTLEAAKAECQYDTDEQDETKEVLEDKWEEDERGDLFVQIVFSNDDSRRYIIKETELVTG